MGCSQDGMDVVELKVIGKGAYGVVWLAGIRNSVDDPAPAEKPGSEGMCLNTHYTLRTHYALTTQSLRTHYTLTMHTNYTIRIISIGKYSSSRFGRKSKSKKGDASSHKGKGDDQGNQQGGYAGRMVGVGRGRFALKKQAKDRILEKGMLDQVR
jgi:hypothetical protein